MFAHSLLHHHVSATESAMQGHSVTIETAIAVICEDSEALERVIKLVAFDKVDGSISLRVNLMTGRSEGQAYLSADEALNLAKALRNMAIQVFTGD
jgi:hypothetical protein